MSVLADYQAIPKRVQAIIDDLDGGAGDRAGCCSQCRDQQVTKVLRCSRCQAAHYCSASCQKKHFPFHKSLCKKTYKHRTAAEQKKLQNPHDDDSAAWEMIYLADTLVIMGYRETDTIENGKSYYRKALYWYLESRKILEMNFFATDLPLDDKVLVLLAILGGTVETLTNWCIESGTYRRYNFMAPLIPCVDHPEFTTQGLVKNDPLFQCVSVLVSMRSLLHCRRDVEAFEIYQQEIVRDQLLPKRPELQALEGISSSLIRPFVVGTRTERDGSQSSLVDLHALSTQLFVRALTYHGNYSYLQHLRDTIPFTPAHAPNLLCGGGEPNDPIFPISHTQNEFWLLFQDCFFLTPGLNDILHEFVPEEDDPILDDEF